MNVRLIRWGVLFAFLCSLVLPSTIPTALAAPVAVGAGTYYNGKPAAQSGPVVWRGNGAQSFPASSLYKTSAVTGAVPTNDWWSSLIWPFNAAANPYSEVMHAHPLSFLALSNGLGISYPTYTAIDDPAAKPYPFVLEYHNNYSEDFRLSVAGLNAPDTRLDDYGDWTISALWNGGGSSLRATFGRGLPFVYATKTGGNAQLIFNGNPTVWAGSGTNTLGVTINGHHYGLFAPAGAVWNRDNAIISSALAGNNYFSIALLPAASTSVLDKYRQYAFSFVSDSRVSWSYNESTAQIQTTYELTIDPKAAGAPNSSIMALFRHHEINLAGGNALLDGNVYKYTSPRGTMRVREARSFTTSMRFNGVLPSLPNIGSYDKQRLYDYVMDFRAEDRFWAPMHPESDRRSREYADDTYWTGKNLNRLGQLVHIADQLSRDTALNSTQRQTMAASRDIFLDAMQSKLEDWFRADELTNAEADKDYFYYEPGWGTLIGVNASYGSEGDLNDHHFHYGYYIQASAILGMYRPSWISDSNWGGMVKLLAKDANNWDANETRFPRLRNFDPYMGVNYASGHAAMAAGNNQESSSEGINYSTGLILFGSLNGDTAMRNAGIYLYTTEAAAIDQYWFDVDGQTFPNGFAVNQQDVADADNDGNTSETILNRFKAIGINWGNGGAYALWFGAFEPEKTHGINYLPITGGSLHLGQPVDAVRANYAFMRNNIYIHSQNPPAAYQADGVTSQPRVWEHVAFEYLALYDANQAAQLFDQLNDEPEPYGGGDRWPQINYDIPEEGETYAHTYHWIQNLRHLGHVDHGVVANIPTYAVFNNNGTRTYVAYNPGGSSRSVTFTNLATNATITCSVAARSMIAVNGSSCDSTNPPPDGDGTPWNGTRAVIPGTIQAEHYNEGGANVAYSDVDTVNNGGQFRNDQVDIEIATDTSGSYNVGWTRTGEWLKYSVSVAQTGSYNFAFRVASATGSPGFRVEIDGVDVTGTVAVPNTGGWQTWTTVTKNNINLTAGNHLMRIVFVGDETNLNYIQVSNTTQPPTGRDAYSVIEAESRNEHQGTANYSCQDGTGCAKLGSIGNGDWARYSSVNFGAQSPIDVQFRVSSGVCCNASGLIELRLDSPTGPLLASLAVGNTGGFESWQTIPMNVQSVTGTRNVYLRFVSGAPYDFVDINWFRFRR